MASKRLQIGLLILTLGAAGYLWRRAIHEVSPLSSAEPGPSVAGQVIQSVNRTDLNPYILDVIGKYPTDGSIRQTQSAQVAKSYGVTEDMYYEGEKVLRKTADGTCYCSGLMIEVYLKACASYSRTNGYQGAFRLEGIRGRADFEKFRKDFYGVSGDRRTFVAALTDRKLGEVITDLKQAKPGDMVQFWRHQGTGHSVIFLGWDTDPKNEITGILYWSVQKKNGIAVNREDVGGGSAGAIEPSQIYIVRPHTPTAY